MAVVIFIAVVSVPRERIPTARGPVYPVKERTQNGHRELSTDWLPLDGITAAKGERIDWQVLVYTDPKKPPFVFSVRCGTSGPVVWEAEAKQPATLDVDGRRIDLPCRRGELRRAGVVWTVVDCEGKLDDLNAAAKAKRVQFGFAGQTVDLGERGVDELRELWRRSEAK